MIRVVEVLVWWAAPFGVWLLTLSTLPVAELTVAAAAALLCAVAATVGRRAADERWRVRARWLRWLVVLPVAVVADACRVLLVPLRRQPQGRPPGRLREIRLEPETDGTLATTRLAVATTVLSVAPGTFVVDTHSEDDVLVVHSLVDGSPRMDDVVRS